MASRCAEAVTSEDETYVISKTKSKEKENSLFVLYVLKLHNLYEYTVPSFTMFHEKLQHIVCQIVDDDDNLFMVNVFFKADCVPQVIPPFSVNVLKFCYVLLENIEKQIPLKDLKLYKDRVLIVWECEDMIDSTCETENMPERSTLALLYSTDDDSNDSSQPSPTAPTSHPHTIIFKCIGAVRDTQSQYALYKAKNKRLSGWSVPVRMTPEPTNIVDAQAIMFECKLEEKWEKIGYVVSDILHEVHAALSNNLIVEVKFQRVKYITDWTHSGPGCTKSCQ